MASKFSSNSHKRPHGRWNNANHLEVVKDITSDIGRSLKEDLIAPTVKDILSESAELFGLKPRKKISGTLSPNETLDLTVLEAQKEEIRFEERPMRAEQTFRTLPENFLYQQKERAMEQEVEALLEEIKKEIKRFDEATRKLENETAKVVVEEIPPNPGIYHINFFEWLLGILKNLRQKIEDAGAWLSVIQSKKTKKGYWAKFKKHGTSFGLAPDRLVATQTG